MFIRDGMAVKLSGAEHINNKIKHTGLTLPYRAGRNILSVKFNILNTWKQFT